jgi:tetratricopeptide (TPR) repeat protein
LWERGDDRARAEAQALAIPDTLHPGAMSFVLQLLPDKAQRIQFLRGLQRRYPGDYSVNVTLASNLTSPGTLRGERPPQPADINEAIGFLRAAVALRPSVPSVRGSLASALGKGSRPEQVEEGIAIARALAGDESTADVGLGSLSALLRQTGRPDDAVAVYREAIRRWPAKAQYHYALGQLLSKNQSWGEAAEAYREAIRLSPQEAHYHASLGETLRKKNALGEATAAYAEAARLNPKAPSYQFALGETLEAIHDPIAAAAAFATAARLQPNEPANHFRRALVLMQVEQWAESAAALVEAIRRRPDAKAYYCYLAKALSEQGQLWEADATFEVADLVRDPREDKNVRAFIDALFADDRLRLSTRLTGAGILSLFGTMRPRLDESRPGVERRLLVGHKRASLTPDDTAALNDLAWLLATGPFPDLRDPAEAVRLATRATELIPNDGDLWNTLGAARYRAGDWAASATALEKSMQLRRGGDAFDWFFLAMCRRQLGDHDQARKWYDRAANSMTKKDAQDDELRRFRAEAAELLGIPADPKPEPPAKAGETPKAPGG